MHSLTRVRGKEQVVDTTFPSSTTFSELAHLWAAEKVCFFAPLGVPACKNSGEQMSENCYQMKRRAPNPRISSHRKSSLGLTADRTLPLFREGNRFMHEFFGLQRSPVYIRSIATLMHACMHPRSFASFFPLQPRRILTLSCPNYYETLR